MRKQVIRTAIVGSGWMGKVHLEAIRRLGYVEAAVIVASSQLKAQQFADEWGLPRATASYQEVLSDPAIQTVHICAPNDRHFQMARDALNAGKHVVCEKPLANTVEEGEALVNQAAATGLANCCFFNVRSYPHVRHMRSLVQKGHLGELWVLQGTYSQDWLFHDTDWNWRIDAGASRTFADIGSHWCDLAEFITGGRIASLCADMHTVHPTRKKAAGSVETFAGKMQRATHFTQVPVNSEDFANVIFRMDNGARGTMSVSQISAGRKNRVFIELFGSKRGMAWNAEEPDQLWIGERDEPNRLQIKDPSMMDPANREFADFPGGHSEGFDDTFKQTARQFYNNVRDRTAEVNYPTFADGLRQLKVLEAVLTSVRTRGWVDVQG
jgi:predicted dehydrogenase